jgi:DNA (cytosine-5)-methyltransferase 1
MTFGSLFSGIGGIDLGLERAGMICRWQVEIDGFCRRVLEKHWPGVRRYDDVRTFPPDGDEDWNVDLIAGGFPCQDVSLAGKGAGIDGARSGLWSEFHRVVRLLRPSLVLVENVPGLYSRGLGRVLGDLASCGYDAEWDCLSAASVGAPHLRERVFVVAHAQRGGRDGIHERVQPRHMEADAVRCGRHRPDGSAPADNGRRVPGEGPEGRSSCHSFGSRLAFGPCLGGDAREELAALERANRADGGQWGRDPAESGLGRVVDGIPDRVDRLRSLGNAVVPQNAEFVGRRIMKDEPECLDSTFRDYEEEEDE